MKKGNSKGDQLKKLSSFLQESLDSPYKWRWAFSNSYENDKPHISARARFQDDAKNHYFVDILGEVVIVTTKFLTGNTNQNLIN